MSPKSVARRIPNDVEEEAVFEDSDKCGGSTFLDGPETQAVDAAPGSALDPPRGGWHLAECVFRKILSYTGEETVVPESEWFSVSSSLPEWRGRNGAQEWLPLREPISVRVVTVLAVGNSPRRTAYHVRGAKRTVEYEDACAAATAFLAKVVCSAPASRYRLDYGENEDQETVDLLHVDASTGNDFYESRAHQKLTAHLHRPPRFVGVG